jgi:hypothetical protein
MGVRCRDATIRSLVAKLEAKSSLIFTQSPLNWLLGLLGWILCEQYSWCQREWWAYSRLCSSLVPPFFRSRRIWFPHVGLMLSSPNTCLNIARVSVALFPRFTQIWYCSFFGSIVKSNQVRYTTPNKRTDKISTSTQLHRILYTDSQDMLVLRT